MNQTYPIEEDNFDSTLYIFACGQSRDREGASKGLGFRHDQKENTPRNYLGKKGQKVWNFLSSWVSSVSATPRLASCVVHCLRPILHSNGPKFSFFFYGALVPTSILWSASRVFKTRWWLSHMKEARLLYRFVR